MEENKPRGVPLSPKSMVDSVADWPLHRVIEHLRQKEKGDIPDTATVFCRSTFKALPAILDQVASRYGVSRNQVSIWLTYHGIAIAREDGTIGRLSSVYSQLRQSSLLVDDTDTIDMMESLLPYSPRIQDDKRCKLSTYDWVSSAFEELSVVCGVPRFRIMQVFVLKSVLSDAVDDIEATAQRMDKEISRWDRWMRLRLGALENLLGNS